MEYTTITKETVKAGAFRNHFDGLFNELYAPLVHFSDKYTEDTNISKDIVQETFVNFWIKFSGSGELNAGKNYLYRSVYNATIDYLRKCKVEQKRLNGYVYSHDKYAAMRELVSENDLRYRIEKIKAGLPAECKRIFILSRDEGLTYKKIAEKLGISVKTVESQVSKALKLFRKYTLEYTD